jgi:hypothetical protein
MTPPLRFLLTVIGGWACVRAAVLAPWAPGEQQPTTVAPGKRPLGAAATMAKAPAAVAPPKLEKLAPRRSANGRARVANPLPTWPLPSAQSDRKVAAALLPQMVPNGLATPLTQLPAYLLPQRAPIGRDVPRLLDNGQVQPAFAPPATPSRWSLSAWLLARRGGSPALASAGTLGASQAGARIGYRITGPATEPVSLTARLSSPARSLQATEAAVGVEWQPSRRLPLRLAAERRQAIGRDGRSTFALLAHGGVTALPVAFGFRVDAYGQAGVVGARSRDLFADGAARLTLPLDRRGRVVVGAGAWAATQPGVSRIDVGPSASLSLSGATLSLDWRVRIAGGASPASGPALTLSTGF